LLSSVVDIKKLQHIIARKHRLKRTSEMIADFDQLSELRGCMWEECFMVKKNTKKEFDGVKIELKAILKKCC